MRGRIVRRRGAPNRNVQIAQILTLLVLLIIVLTFRTKVSDSAGRFLELFAVEGDLVVEQDAPRESEAETPTTATVPENTQPDMNP